MSLISKNTWPIEGDCAKEIRDHAWKHFALHADQRLKTFNFFLIAATLLSGAAVGAVKDLKSPVLGASLSFFLAFLSFVFWKLDQRAKALIRHAEEALKYWEEQIPIQDDNRCPHVTKVFTREAFVTNLMPRPHFSYSKCLGLVFLAFFALGLGMGTYLIAARHSISASLETTAKGAR